VFLLLLAGEQRGLGIEAVFVAAGASVLSVAPLFLGSRWFAFLNRHFGVLIAWLLCGLFPALFSAMNLAIYELRPSWFSWRNIGVVWGLALAVMLVVLG
jgi:hypothetical protein